MSVTGALIVPHPPLLMPEIGRGEEKKIQKTIDAYKQAAKRAKEMQPDVLVVLSPHSVMYADYFHISPKKGASGNFAAFGAPDLTLKVSYDTELVQEICRQADAVGLAAGTKGERDSFLDHGTMVPLRFLQETLGGIKIVRIGLSGLSFQNHFMLGKCIERAAKKLNRRIVLVASGDLSHRLLNSGPYEYAKEGPAYDEYVTNVVRQGNVEAFLHVSEDFCEKAGECGQRSFVVMAGCLADVSLKSELLSYEGPFGVGYAVACFQDAYVALARQSLSYYLKKNKMLPLPKALPEEMLQKKAGVFVSLKEGGRLRGCIGTIEGVQKNVAEEILENAVSAGVYDPRFYPVEAAELPRLICTVDVLSEAEPISSMEELDVKRYGVIVSCGQKRGLLLPNLEGVDTAEEQVAIALQKAGIEEAVDSYQMERFEVVRHY